MNRLLFLTWLTVAISFPIGAANLGEYGPVYSEPGFHPNGGYFEMGFEAMVNHFGGNLIITSTDVAIPSIGGFDLSFTRTYNSNRAYDAEFALPSSDYDGPLGLGWVGHLGVLYPNGSDAPEWSDPSGARERFFSHDHLNGQIPISGTNGLAWISKSLKVLVLDGSDYLLYFPNGTRYRLAFEDNNLFYKPVAVTDAFGNTWSIDYLHESDTEYTVLNIDVGVVNHPLIHTIRDDFGRILQFHYTTIGGKKRLQRISLSNQTMAEYTYKLSSSLVFLERHKTGEGRTTTFTTDLTNPGRGTVTAIELDTGGTMTIDYVAKNFFYRQQEPVPVYAVESHSFGGGSWDFTYPSSAATSTFTVTVDGPENYSAAYDYLTYESVFNNTPLYKVGKLIRAQESYNGTTRIREYAYGPFKISNDLTVGQGHGEAVQIARMLQERLHRDGIWQTTDYSYSPNHFHFPVTVSAPGRTTTSTYLHRNSASLYYLGLPVSEEIRVGNSLVGRTTWNSYNGALPNYLRFYSSSNQYDQLNLTYHTTPGKKGAQRTKNFGGLTRETYDYANGVLKSIDYPSGIPDVTRVINANGTLASELSNGVTKTFSWDDDFRLTGITQPDDNVQITYTSNTVTKTQGDSWLRETYDDWGPFECQRSEDRWRWHCIQPWLCLQRPRLSDCGNHSSRGAIQLHS